MVSTANCRLCSTLFLREIKCCFEKFFVIMMKNKNYTNTYTSYDRVFEIWYLCKINDIFFDYASIDVFDHDLEKYIEGTVFER
jgi:hypothetical protein